MKRFFYLVLSLFLFWVSMLTAKSHPFAYQDVDLGDNPHGFQNQGVWIVPVPNKSGWWESYFVKRQEDKLWYRADDKGNTIPDFSFCGYRMGNEPLPVFPVVATISPMQGDARGAIQALIDSVAQHIPLNAQGVRGAILIKSGTYNISGTINLNASGIVLRGEGQGEDQGSVLIATSTSGSLSNPDKLIRVGHSTGSLQTHSGTDIVVPYIPVGAKYVIVAKGHSFAKGDKTAIYQVFNDKLIQDLKMDVIPNRSDGTPSTQWLASDYQYYFEREVHRVSSAGAVGDSIFFYNPIVNALDQEYNATRRLYKATYPSRISNSGVENLLLKSVYASDEDENHAWDAIYFDRAEHCWAKGISAKYFAYALANISRYAKYITVDGGTCLSPKSVITGGRRYSFNIDGQMCLVKNCFASQGRHDYAQGSKVCGPNVFTNSIAENAYADIGPHHRWATGTLYDKLTTDNTINVQDRSSYGTGHGWAGANMVFWGCKGKSSICQNPQVYAKNYNIGFMGQYIDNQTFGDRPRGDWEGNNVEGLDISSLYEEQCKARGLDLPFGLMNNALVYVNDSTFRLSFTDSLDVSSASAVANYNAWGSAGISGQPRKVTVINYDAVELVFSISEALQYNTQLRLSVSGVTSKRGSAIQGINSAYLNIPDLRPEVSMTRQRVHNSSVDSVVLSSSKQGTVYLASGAIKPEAVADLENGIAVNKVAVTRDITKDTEVQIGTNNLLAGLYYAYAVDDEGRISSKSTNYVLISAASGLSHSETLPFARIFYSETDHKVNVKFYHTGQSRIEVYNLSGQLLLCNETSSNDFSFTLPKRDALVVVKVSQGDRMQLQKLIIT